MKRVFGIILTITPLLVLAQPIAITRETTAGPGIQFETELSWHQILAKAKADNKYIFVDCYTTWCGPCKYMTANIFPLKEVGDFFNSHFICVAVQMDKTEKDPRSVRQWYNAADSISRIYGIGAYPTYLFFSPDGVAVHRIVGSMKDGKEFIARASNALNPKAQYYTAIEKYKLHSGDSVFLRNALIRSLAISDYTTAQAIVDVYLDCLRDPFAKENLDLVRGTLVSGKCEGNVWELFLHNPARIDSVLGEKDYVRPVLSMMVCKEYITPLFALPNARVDWGDIVINLKGKYPMLGDELIQIAKKRFDGYITKRNLAYIYERGLEPENWEDITQRLKIQYPGCPIDSLMALEKCKYYLFKEEWAKYEEAISFYMDKYGEQLSEVQKNSYAWEVFLHCTDQKLLTDALNWMKRTIDTAPNYTGAIDTYANLLYKTGDIEDALSWERKAIDIAVRPVDKKEFSVTLEKMERGIKTWED